MQKIFNEFDNFNTFSKYKISYSEDNESYCTYTLDENNQIIISNEIFGEPDIKFNSICFIGNDYLFTRGKFYSLVNNYYKEKINNLEELIGKNNGTIKNSTGLYKEIMSDEYVISSVLIDYKEKINNLEELIGKNNGTIENSTGLYKEIMSNEYVISSVLIDYEDRIKNLEYKLELLNK